MDQDVPAYSLVPGRYGVEVKRVGEVAVECRIPFEPDKIGADGGMRLAAVLMGIDMGAGVAAGLGVMPDWSITSDASVRMLGEARVGPLRIDAHCLKVGRSQCLAEITVVDEGAEDLVVALATANHAVMSPPFENVLMRMRIGETVSMDRPVDAGTGELEDHFGVCVGPGEVRIPVDDRTRNPWGILHGGLTGLVVEAAAASVGVTRPAELMMRYLRPVREGPGVARVVEDLLVDGRRLLRIEMRDQGADRLAVLAHVMGR